VGEEKIEEEEEEEELQLFTAKLLEKAATEERKDVAPRGAAVEKFEELKEETQTRRISRTEWEDSQDSEDEDEMEMQPEMDFEVVEDVEKIEDKDEDEESEDVAMFSTRLLEERPVYKRERVDRSRVTDRTVLSNLCAAFPLEQIQDEGKDLPNVETVTASLPAPAVVIPFPGEQPPSPDTPRKKVRRKIEHKQWVFNEDPAKEVDKLVSKRTRKRHPGIPRKMRATIPDMVEIDLREQERAEEEKTRRAERKKALEQEREEKKRKYEEVLAKATVVKDIGKKRGKQKPKNFIIKTLI